MSMVAVSGSDLRLFRRVMRFRKLVAGPLAMENQLKHDPVMVDEILEAFQLQPGMVVADCTVGLGGHSARFLEQIGESGTLVAFDHDESMLDLARTRLEELSGARMHFVHADFRSVYGVFLQFGLKANAILMDLGLNSAQIDDPSRGISFRENGRLDMRMDRSKGEPASALLNRMAPGEIEAALWEFGDERWARKIARCIVERRKSRPLLTTDDLVECVLAAIPVGARDKRIHPATRTFQAIRILVNSELDGLDDALKSAAEVLAPNGTLVILSYHSGEDRIVKNTFRELAAQESYEELFRKPLVPTNEEIARNSRARSAKMRGLRRVG
jgi:16S rRNA (cytosine1402-N4)-methyltransferase